MHKKVQEVVISEDNTNRELLLLKTNESRGEFWQNVTGSVELGESFKQAALRELKEETGLIPSSFFELDININFKDQWSREVEEKCFLAFATHSSAITIDSKEHCAFKWLEVKNVTRENYKFESNWNAFLIAKGII